MKINYESPLTRLSLLQHVSSSFSSDSLKDVYLIGCQHLLPSTHLMMRSLFDSGLRPERTALIGKCYSTSTITQNLMREEGIYVCPSSTQFDSHQSYDSQFQRNMSTFLEDSINKLKIPSHAKLIVLDDGGELLSIINKFSSRFKHIIGIEQTSSGYHKLSGIDLNIPVVNVARCSTKLVMESSMVIEAQIQAMNNALNSLALRPEKALIIGNGALGNHLSQALRAEYQVVCYDKIARLSDIHELDLDLSTFDLIIGATGTPILAEEHFKSLKDNVILVSVSSSDREFNASCLRKEVGRPPNCHADLFIDGVYLLNCGFPINFQGADEDTIPLEKIQLTIALMFLGVFQGVASHNLQEGFVNLSNKNQKIVLNKFYSINKNETLHPKYIETNLKKVVSF